jgi:ATP-dependent Clp protease ATP-binding subunit ClpA
MNFGKTHSTSRVEKTTYTSVTREESTHLSPIILVSVAISLAGAVIGLNQLNPWFSPALLLLALVGMAVLWFQDRLKKGQTAIANSPEEDYSKLASMDLGQYGSWLKTNVRGQDEAVDAIVSSLQGNVGLARPGRILGAYFLVGPTGTGKTFLSHLIAKILYPESEPVVLRMNQFKSASDVFTLLGAPPGTPGYEVGGALTRPILENPARVVILDEINMAHPDLHHCLYDILDSGSCREKSSGRMVDFSRCVFFATSNAGFDSLRALRAKINPAEDPAAWLGQSRDVLVSAAGFDRAFLARWTEILLMDELAPIHVAEVACLELSRYWQDYGIEVKYAAPELIFEAVQKNAEFKQYGVRQLGNYIQKKTNPGISQARSQGFKTVRLNAGPTGLLEVVPISPSQGS